MKCKKWMAASLLCAALGASVFAGGCGKQNGSGMAQQATKVTTTKAFRSDTPIVYEYTGNITAMQEVPVRARVSGTVVEKFVTGGQTVEEGQPLFRIDTRQYESALVAAQASEAQAGANYQNAAVDLARYEQLIGSGAISQQAYDSAASAAEQLKAAYEAAGAQARIAADNLDDTIVRAPFAGKLSMDDVNIGTFATAGNTPLVTISSTDPVYVQFDMSEAEYLEMARKNMDRGAWGAKLKLRLSDGKLYGETGHVVQVNPGLSGGRMSLKASFENPQGLLIPGMYGTVISDAETASGVLLIPTQAVIQLLNRNLVDVVEDGKVVQKPIEIGGTYGIYTIVKSGITTDDVIIVEGQGKVRVGQPVAPEEMEKEALAAKISEQNQDSHSTAK